MNKHKFAIIKFAISFALLFFYFFVLFYKTPLSSAGFKTHFNILFASISFSLILYFYKIKISEIRNNLSMEAFNAKRKKIKLILFCLSWVLISIVEIVRNYELYPNIFWLRIVSAGLVFAAIVLMALYVTDYIYAKKISNRNT